MSIKTKALAFPTAADIREHIDTNISPEIGRIGGTMDAIWQAVNVLAERDTGDTLSTLVWSMITDGTTPTPEQIADAALDSRNHVTNVRTRETLDILRQNVRDSRLRYPTGEQNEETLDYLAGVVDQIADAARALPADTPLNAEDAITYGEDGIELLNTIRVLVGSYGEVRRAQKKAYGGSHEALNPSGHFKDAVNVDAYWLRRRAATAEQHRYGLERGDAPGVEQARAYFLGTPRTPWEPIKGGAYPANAANNEDYARFILWAARNAQLWVPTVADLEQQHLKNMELVAINAWLYPADRRNISQADIDQALASVKNRETATA